MGAKLVSESFRIADFFKGLAGRHVDYATRHYSRAYAIGHTTTFIALLASPFVLCFCLGVLVGRLTG